MPGWWEPLLTRVRSARTEDFTRWVTPSTGGRASAVLVLLGEQDDGGPDVLVLQRAATLRNHAGQPAFPGGAAEPGDASLAGTALREAEEEVGLDQRSVTVLAELPRLWIPVSDFVVTPVLAWWHAPHPVHPRDPGEVAQVARLPVDELVAPENRLRVRHPSGWVGPAFRVRGMLVWGFTAGILAVLLEMGGWSRPWPQDRVAELPPPGTAVDRAPRRAQPEPGFGGGEHAPSSSVGAQSEPGFGGGEHAHSSSEAAAGAVAPAAVPAVTSDAAPAVVSGTVPEAVTETVVDIPDAGRPDAGPDHPSATSAGDENEPGAAPRPDAENEGGRSRPSQRPGPDTFAGRAADPRFQAAIEPLATVDPVIHPGSTGADVQARADAVRLLPPVP